MAKFVSIVVISLVLVIFSFASAATNKLVPEKGTSRQLGGGYGVGGIGGGGCPLCDSSVYSYCSHKLAHDGCCCGGNQYGNRPVYGCQYTDCQYLYAQSCYEYQLIKDCCCENPYQ